MKSMIRYCSVMFLIATFFCCGIAFAEEQAGSKRVIEESLLILDPTVAPSKKATIGLNLEYWYVTQKYDTPGNASASGDLDGSMPGFSFFVGFDDTTLQASYRDASWNANQRISSQSVDYKKTLTDKEFELSLRQVLYKSRWINPYALLGYNVKESRSTSELTTPNAVWDVVFKPVVSGTSYHNSILTGLGNITPINKWFGLRSDMRVMWDRYRFHDDTGQKIDNWGAWYRTTHTGYVNLFEGINLQTGFRYDILPGRVNNDIARDKFGFFASLGYSYKF